MARAKNPYRRLGRGYAGVVSYHRLWLGTDHLLSVTSIGWSEEYRRIYLRDIQAITICQTNFRLIGNMIFGALVVVLPLIGAGSPSIYWRNFWYVVGGVSLLLFIINSALGPGCVCQIRTAVQTGSLPTHKRFRQARKLVARLRPLIEAAQGTLDRGQASTVATPPAHVASKASEMTGDPSQPQTPAPGEL